MAYLAPVEVIAAQPVSFPAMRSVTVEQTDFSALEWSIIRLSRGDRLWTLRPPGPLRRFHHWLLGRTGSPGLANDRLEALRRISVLSWHFGFSIPDEDVADFLSAGFTADQYELLVSRLSRASGSNVHDFPVKASI
jgi:hypothetical protein